jgi:nucleoside-diphosphate-sugar epimerase
MLRLIGQEIGQFPQILNVPTIEQAKALGIFDKTFAREYVELFYQYTEPQIVVSSAFEQAFGLHATPLDEAIHTTVQWYREHAHA